MEVWLSTGLTLSSFSISKFKSNNIILLFPTAVLVNIENPFNFQDLLSFLRFIKTPFKRVLSNKIGCLSLTKKGCVISHYFIFYVSLNLPNFSLRAILYPGPSQSMPFFKKKLNIEDMAKKIQSFLLNKIFAPMSIIGSAQAHTKSWFNCLFGKWFHLFVCSHIKITALHKWGGAHQTSNHIPKPNL